MDEYAGLSNAAVSEGVPFELLCLASEWKSGFSVGGALRKRKAIMMEEKSIVKRSENGESATNIYSSGSQPFFLEAPRAWPGPPTPTLIHAQKG